MKADLKIFAEDLDSTAAEQIKELCASPLMDGEKLRIMPDAHAGVGCVVGTTMTYTDKICPNIVGVDIGCGMLVAELGNLQVKLADLDDYIKQNIPSGQHIHKKVSDDTGILPNLRCIASLKNTARIYKSLGTLGGGNHFIEMNEDNHGNKYLVIHSGSRNLGTQVARYYQNIANNTNFLGNLSYLTDQNLVNYLHDMKLTQAWAAANRYKMFESICTFLEPTGKRNIETWETVHNYVSHRDSIIRKGAVSAAAGEKILIPLNMSDGSLICQGKGNPDWNYSAPHGAGRLMSRRAAKEKLDLAEFISSMQGIYTTTATNHTLDEAPMAYKDAETIKRLIEPTAELLCHIRPIYNFKAPN